MNNDNSKNDKKEKLDVWKEIFITKDIDSLKGVDPVMDEVIETIHRLNKDPNVIARIEAQEAKKREYAKKLKELGNDAEAIAAYTGIPVEEIEKL